MKNKFYLKEFQFFDGEDTVVFNILSVEGSKITVAVTKCGKISVVRMKPCFQNSKKTCMNCKHYGYCDRANRCNGDCGH